MILHQSFVLEVIKDMLCPICESLSSKDFVSIHNHNIFKCHSKDCGHLFVGDQVDDQGVMEQQDADKLYETYKERNCQLIRFWEKRGFISEKKSVLDVGAGTGHILRSLKDRFPNVSITCIEPSRNTKSNLINFGFNVVDSFNDLAEEFDALLLIEVIEHVKDPVFFLSLCKANLKNSGKIFLTTPCGELRNGSRYTNAYDTKEHVHFFTEKSLELTCKKSGLSVIKLEKIPELYPKQTSESQLKDYIKTYKSKIKKYINILRFQGNTNPKIGFNHLVGFIEYQ